MKARELMTGSVFVLSPEQTLGEAAQLFIDKKIDGAPVVDSTGTIRSIITKTDIMRAYAALTAPDTVIGLLPEKEVQTVRPETNILDVWNRQIGRLPVVDNAGLLTGMLTRTDLCYGLYRKGIDEGSGMISIFDSNHNGVIQIDGNGRVKACNEAAFEILGLSSREVLNTYSLDTVPELALEEILREGYVQRTERLEFRGRPLLCSKIPLLKAEGATEGLIVFQHVSDYRSVVAELDAARSVSKKLDVIIESSFDGIFITDGQANALMVNKSYETITGLKREDLIGHNMHELVETKVISESASLLVLQNKIPITLEQEFRTGKKALVTSTPILDADGEVAMVVTNVRDITALISLQRQMEKNRELAHKYLTEIEEMRLQVLNASDIIAHDERTLDMLRLAKRVAKVDTTVLILGETGVGKEEVAKFIHKNSSRQTHGFIRVNCGAIPENLMESELFGYEKGAFTGASKEGKMGLFEVANGGTLFLDEVGELPFDMQVRLLRVLQEHEIIRIGGIRPIKVDVRIIAATNRNLEDMVRNKRFREDLYYRLHVVPISILPLRERKEDILPLIQHYITDLNKKYGWQKSFSKDAMTALFEYQWPGNVRELKNIVERLIVMSDQDLISQSDFHGITEFAENRQKAPDVRPVSMKDAVDQLEAELIERAYEKHRNVRDAARELKIDASTFVRKRQKMIKRL